MSDNNRAKLFQKILAVQRVLQPLEKSGRNDFHRYSYTTSSDVLLPVQSACNAHGLVVIADVIETKIFPERAAAEVLVRLSVVDAETGESYSITASGYAEDWSYKDNRATGDKAVYKSTTGAIKYAVRAFFCLPSEDDPERSTPVTSAPAATSSGNGKRPAQPVTNINTSTPASRPPLTQSEEPPAPEGIGDGAAALLEATTSEMTRCCWDTHQGREYLDQVFGQRSRKHLTPAQLRDFLEHLRSLPTAPREPTLVAS